MICEFLFFDENGEKKEKINYIDLKIQIRELLKNQFEREVLTAVLMDLRKDVTGKTQEDIFHMYQDLDLHKDAYKSLNSWRWERVSKGIFELTQMEVKDAYSLITRFINDKRATIRKQAEIATVSLKDEGINYFLDHTRYKISEWQQLKLLDVVRNKKDYVPPPFRLWLTSKNNHVVLFVLRLIKYYNQNDASASLIQLLRHKNNQIKKEAIFCIRDFHVTEAVPELKHIFWKCTTDIKMDILEALSHLGTDEDIGFIENIVEKEMAFTVKGKAITALNTIRPEGILPTKDIQPKEDFEDSASASILQVSALNDEIPPEQNEETAHQSDIPFNSVKTSEKIVKPKKTVMEIKPKEISFLPIVTEKDSMEPNHNHNTAPIVLNEMKVNAEEVLALSVTEELHANFLPVVISDELEPSIDNLNDFSVVFDVIMGNEQKNRTTTITENFVEELRVDFEEVESVIESTVPKGESIRHQNNITRISIAADEITFSDEIAPKTILDLNVSHEVVQPEMTEIIAVEPEIFEVDWSTAFMDNTKMPNIKTEEIRDWEETAITETFAVPKPSFYGQNTLETIVLLEYIAELGDHREIPFLQELLKQHNNEAIVDRIHTLLAGFSKVDENQELLDFSLHEVRQSIFHNLLEDKDVEVKLLLLDEIAAVGDEKEIPLLNELILDDKTLIRNSAKEALKQIHLRVSHISERGSKQEPFEIVSENKKIQENKDENPLLNISVKVDLLKQDSIENRNRPVERSYGNTLFDHLCATSSKLYNKVE